MDLQYLKKLLKIFDDSTAEDLEIEEKGIKLKISKNKEDKVNGNVPIINLSGALPSNQNYQPQHQHVQPTTTPSQPSAPAETKVETSVGLHEIKAPMVVLIMLHLLLIPKILLKSVRRLKKVKLYV